MVDSFKNTREQIDQRLREREKRVTQNNDDVGVGQKYKSAEAQRVFDNIKFGDRVEEQPITSKRYDKLVMGYVYITFNNYIHNRIWPRSIYTTDKITRLAVSAKLEFLKRYLSKKRHVPMNLIWIIIIMFIVVIVIVIVLLLLPSLGVM
jgi:hypothetical protein